MTFVFTFPFSLRFRVAIIASATSEAPSFELEKSQFATRPMVSADAELELPEEGKI